MEREYQENLAKNKGERWVSCEGRSAGMVMISLVHIMPFIHANRLLRLIHVHVSPDLLSNFRSLERGKQEGRG